MPKHAGYARAGGGRISGAALRDLRRALMRGGMPAGSTKDPKKGGGVALIIV